MKRKHNKKQTSTTLKCPYCGAHAVLKSADGIYRDNSKGEMLYVCKNYPACDSYVRVQKGTNIPLGTLANKKLRELRKEAHHYFDMLYKTGLITKTSAYEWLSGTLLRPLEYAHIGMLGEYDCQIVIAESKKYLKMEMEKRKARKEDVA